MERQAWPGGQGARAAWAWALLLLTALLSLASPAEASQALVITNLDSGQNWRVPLGSRAELTLRFFHSYDRQWVEESFALEGGRFCPLTVSYADDSYDWRHQRYRASVRVDAKAVRLGHIQPAASDLLPAIILRVAHEKPQTLTLTGAAGRRALTLTSYGRAGQRLRLSLD